MNLLLTNDDGIKAPGLKALAQGLKQHYAVRVAAPVNEKSACSHSISLGQKLRIEEFRQDGLLCYGVHGTPVDCVKFALSELRDFRPDLIISGINQGANTGVSVYYSGTISAAREGLINGIPAMAVSLCSKTCQNFSSAVLIAQQLTEAYRVSSLPRHVVLNVNVPPLLPGEIAGVKITKQAASRFIEEFVKEEERDGKRVYTLAGEIELMDPDGTSDEEAVSGRFISVSPLKLDLTAYDALEVLRNWAKQI